MKKLLLTLFLFVSITSIAQKDCEYSSNVTDSIGTYKSTNDYLIHERIFGNSQTSIYCSLINVDGLISLNLQMIQISADFIPAKCFDKNSRIYIQLSSGKIITLLGMEQETCGNSVRTNNETRRILTGYFLFMKENYEELKKSTISFIRIKFAGETVDYVTRSELVSEVDKKTYYPENFFINTLKCVE